MSGAAPDGKFQDHYFVLGVAPKATMEEIHHSYQAYVKVCHPTSGTVPDAEKFKEVNLAYEVLSDPATRTMFDSIRPDESKDAPPQFDSDSFFEALKTENNRRLTILCLLYDRRRFKPVLGSLSQRHLEHMISATMEEMQLSMFYLQKRGLVEMNDKSSYLITVDGMDYLEKSPPPPEFVQKMLKAPLPREADADPAAAPAVQESKQTPIAAPPEPPKSAHPNQKPTNPPAQLAALQSALARESKPTVPEKEKEKVPVPAKATEPRPAPPNIRYKFGHQKG